MTAAALSRLPLQAAGYALAYAGRTAMWAVSRYMRNPLTHTAIAALVATSALAASNALFMQTHAHPSPWFVETVHTAHSPQPVVPATRPSELVKPAAAVTAPKVTSPDTTASVARPAVTIPSEPVGNKEVFEIQTKLALMKLFSGTIDGYYGPQTASAIRRFEELAGLTPTGELNRDIVTRILSAPDTLTQPKPQALQPAMEAAPARTVTATPTATAEAPPAMATQTLAPPPQTLAQIIQPAPLTAPVAAPSATATITGSVGTQTMAATRNTFLGRPLPKDANEAVEMASRTANEAIDTITQGVDALAELTQPEAPPAPLKAKQQVASLQTPTPGVPLAIDDEPAAPGEPIAVLEGSATPDQVRGVSVTDPVFVAKVQRGLSSLGFLHGPADGVAGEATAKAIRNFEVYYNYNVTGRISPELLDLLTANGAAI